MAAIARGAAVRPSRFRHWREWLTAYLFLAPFLFFILVFIAGAVALVMAAVLDQKLPFRRFFRIAWYLPCVASSVVTTLIFMWLFLPDGFINAALNFIGLDVRINWLGDEATALPSIMFMNIWATAATMMLIFLAAIQDVPGPIYEAANLDGAGP